MVTSITIVLGLMVVIVASFILQSKVLSKMHKINQERLNRISDKSFEEKNKEIDAYTEMVNIKLDLQKEAEEKFEMAMSKLNKKQQEKILKKKPIIVFPTRGDYLDWLRYEIESDFGIPYERYNFFKQKEGVKDEGVI